MQVYKLFYMVKITLAMEKMKPNQSMLTVHNFITRPLQLMKQEPRIRLIQTSDPNKSLTKAEKVFVS